MNHQSLIGILDSGVGGLSVYLPLRSALPDADILYLADTAFAPYGTKEQSELLDRLRLITRWFQAQGVRLLVLACNTATVNAIDVLRAEFPELQIVGMEPAVKPALEAVNRVIVLGTNSTVTNPRYHDLVTRLVDPIRDDDDGTHEHQAGPVDVTRLGDKVIWHVGANELVEQVESGNLTDPTLLERKLSLVSREAEAVVIGCSHFAFLKPTIASVWPTLQIFDGADGVVSQASRLAYDAKLDQGNGHTQFLTTGPDRTVSFLSPPLAFRHVDMFGDTREVNNRALRE